MAAAAAAPRGAASFELSLTPLRDSDVEALCQERLAQFSGSQGTVVARIVREAQGNPFLALQLTALAHAKLERGDIDLEALSVEELVLRTSELLPDPARNLLSVLAIAGRPLAPQLALSAAAIERDGRSHIHALQGLRLLRTRHVAGVRLLEVYHDRVREAVQASLTSAQRSRVHDRLLRAVEASGRSDPGWMHELAMGAGQRVLALRYGKVAAELASARMAFERASELYARCVTLTDSREELAKLWEKLAWAHTRCRRGVKAAEAYRKASEYAEDPERVQFLRLAASHLLRSGRFEEGESLVRRVLAELQVDVPETTAGIYASIGWERARIAVYAATVKPQPSNVMPIELRRRAELYGFLAVETQNHDLLRAILFQTRAMRLAYQYGEPATLARGLCLTAGLSSMSGTAEAADRAESLLKQAEALMGSTDLNARFELLSTRAVCAIMAADTANAIKHAYEAEDVYETRSAGGEHGDYFYMFSVRALRIGALQSLGRHIVAAAELRESLALARATDNLAAILVFSYSQTMLEQVLDHCASSRARLDREREQLPRAGVGPLHVLHIASVLRAGSVTYDFDWALAALDGFWGDYLKSPIRHNAHFAYILHASRVWLALNRYAVKREQGDPEKLVRESLNWLASKAPEAVRPAICARFRARLALLRGDRRAAAELFRASVAAYTALGAQDDVARDQYVLGHLLDEDEGATLQVSALNALRELGFMEPAQDLRAYYPELFADTARR
jgi:hypothetical protein